MAAWFHRLCAIAFVLTRLCRVSLSFNEAALEWREEYYSGMLIDHFSYFPNDENSTFRLRYLVNDSWWDPNGGPIFFYPGNEGGVEDFARHTGLMWDWAPKFKAMLVFAEHRYYGKSLPFGNLSFQQPNLRFLVVDQALADYGVLIAWLKSNVSEAATSPVITFGGSYGGMLASWLRVKYPSVVTGAIASSAPILYLPDGGAACHSFGAGTVRALAESAPGCDKMADQVRSAINNLSISAEGLQRLNDILRLCNNSLIKDGADAFDLRYFITQTWPLIAMANYPYPSDFFKPLPAWPLKEVCRHLTSPSSDDETLLSNAQRALSVYYNYTGTLNCLSTGDSGTGAAETEAKAWAFQQCADLTLINKCNNGHDVFKPYGFRDARYMENCYKVFKIRPRWDWLTMNYGLRRIRSASNIIFTSGHLDPWGGGSINETSLQGADPSLVAINIRQGAHHLDLQGSHPNDTQEIIDVRNRMKSIVHGWIQTALSKPPEAPVPVPLAPTPASIAENNTVAPSIARLDRLGLPELLLGNLSTPGLSSPEGTSPSSLLGTPMGITEAAVTPTSAAAVETGRLPGSTNPTIGTPRPVAAPSVTAQTETAVTPRRPYLKR